MGVVCRNDAGCVHAAMAAPMIHGCLNPLSVEAVALLHAVKFGLAAGYSKVQLEGDAQSLINLINSHSFALSPIGHLLEEIVHLASFFNSCNFIFCQEEG